MRKELQVEIARGYLDVADLVPYLHELVTLAERDHVALRAALAEAVSLLTDMERSCATYDWSSDPLLVTLRLQKILLMSRPLLASQPRTHSTGADDGSTGA
jgi:hypothetical protein